MNTQQYITCAQMLCAFIATFTAGSFAAFYWAAWKDAKTEVKS